MAIRVTRVVRKILADPVLFYCRSALQMFRGQASSHKHVTRRVIGNEGLFF